MSEQIPAHRRAVTLRSGDTVLVETGAPAAAKKPPAPARPAADVPNT
jgi:hypothetical protein